jgi:hypothetical protein
LIADPQPGFLRQSAASEHSRRAISGQVA